MSHTSELTQNVASTVNIRTLSRPVWYMASPYSHPDPLVREARYKAVCMVAAQYLRQGITVFSPIAHTHPLEVIGFDEAGVDRPETDFWRDLDLPFMEMCCGCVTLRLPGWEKSIGVAGEENWFYGRKLPTVQHLYWSEGLPADMVRTLLGYNKMPGEVIHLPDGTGEEKKADPAGDGWVVPTATELDDEIPY